MRSTKHLICIAALITIWIVSIRIIPVKAISLKDFADEHNLSIVVIGDSYTHTQHGAIKDPWPEQLQRRLGLTNKRFVISRKGNQGFVSGNDTFLYLVNRLKADQEVTHVIVMGGIWNDIKMKCTDDQIKKGFSAFSASVKYKFPNAKILYAAVSWSLKKSRRIAIKTKIPLYKQLCAEHGWIYLNYTSNTMHTNEMKVVGYQPDLSHPNQLGHNKILKRIIHDLKRIENPPENQ